MTGETREAVERLDADVPVTYEPDGADDGRYGPPINRAAQAYAAQAVKQKDHIVAGLLAVFLGLFGLHKFYLGYNETAFIMLAVSIIGSIVSFGLAAAVVWVIAIVEGIIYLAKPQADFYRIYVLNKREWF